MFDNPVEERIARESFENGIKQAYSDFGYSAPERGSYMGARGGKAAPVEPIKAPRSAPRRRRAAPQEPDMPPPLEIPGMQDLISGIKLQDFADLPDDYMIQDPRMAEQLMSTGQAYVDQLKQYYTYLVSQGMKAQEAMNASRQLVSREFKRFSVNR